MANYRAPGVYIEEFSSGSKPITPVGTSTAAFVGVTRKGPVNVATLVTNFSEFERIFGGPYRLPTTGQFHYLYYAVRHFFAQGGGRCYIVRVAHYNNIDDASTLQATAAQRTFDGTDAANAAVSPALTVRARNPGLWGSQELEVRIVTSSKFTARLNANSVANATATQLALQPNDQIQVGSILWLVEEVVGRIASIDPATGQITFAAPLTQGGVNFGGTVNTGIPAYSPGFGYFGASSQAAGIVVTAGTPPTGIRVTPITKVDGSPLRAGDTITFALNQQRLAVTRVGDQGGATVIEFASTNLLALIATNWRLYARDFSIVVRSQGEIVEVHENLSLVNTNRTDHVNVRLGADTNASGYIVANDETPNDLTFINGTAFTALQGGNDGLTNLGDADFMGSEILKSGLHALTPVTDISILAIPNASVNVTRAAIAYCERRRDLFLILEQSSASTESIATYRASLNSKYAALYHPWIGVAEEFTGRILMMPPSGAIAGIYALTDTRRGVHKAPAGLDTGKVTVADSLAATLTKGEYDGLYPKAINAILKIPDGFHVWGSRTISADPEWLQVSVRRLFIFLEKSIENGTQWVTFEPNDPTLWKSIARNVSAFLRIQWLEGKLVGESENEAFFVHCNAETNPPEVVDAGQVVTIIGAAPSRPAEFVIFRIKQKVGQTTG